MTEIDWDKYRNDPSVVVVEGRQHASSQYHFYMETQSAIVYPTEQGGVRVYASTQMPDSIQARVAAVCGLHMNQVTVEVWTG